jgi:hypothetical protein
MKRLNASSPPSATLAAVILALTACQPPTALPATTPAGSMPAATPTLQTMATPTSAPTPSATPTATPEPSEVAEEPPNCLSTAPADIARAATAPTADADRTTSDDVMGDRGELIGYRLTVESSSRGRLSVLLPPESSVADPVGSLVVYTGYSPADGSQVAAIDLESGCRGTLLQPAEVVRSAVLDPTGSGAVYVHSVSAQDRQDLGVDRYDIASGKSSRVLKPVKAREPYGPTYATVLHWSIDGDALAVQSCGAALCRTQVLDIEDGGVESYAGDGHGPLVGLTKETLFVFDGCGDVLPCPLLAIDRQSGKTKVVRDEVYEAVLELVGGQPRLRIKTTTGEEELAP